MTKPNRATLEAKVAAWNSLYEVGQPVVVELDNGKELETVTRYPAQVLQGHSAVIWLVGVQGCYDLSRVRPRIKP